MREIARAAEPLKVVPESSCNPVLTVKALVVLAVTVVLPPRETVLPLIVMLLLVRELLPILDRVLLDPLIVLFVKVSVVALPTSVSVEVGRVKVPVFTMLAITGVVNVGDVSKTTRPLPVVPLPKSSAFKVSHTGAFEVAPVPV